jgi:undecaprenyl phosphate N,N'-diacetylbacillosamine 1-phosphate transferase
MPYRVLIKPFFDAIVALTLLIILSPLLLAVIVLLFVSNGKQVWFLQDRPGKDEKIFRIIKFKTMTDERDSDGMLLPDERRLTVIGKFVRKTSFDEIPQLVNVLKGDMSIVGPRPLLVEYLSLYTKKQKRRHEVKPGITGWAQVNGRNAITWKDKFNLDVWYVEHMSFGLDIKILFLTIMKVLKAEGISSASSQTMEKFRGDQD